MPRYTVSVTAHVIHVQRFDVDADSQELAEEKASELMEDMFPDVSEITDIDSEAHARDPDDAREEEMDRDLNR